MQLSACYESCETRSCVVMKWVFHHLRRPHQPRAHVSRTLLGAKQEQLRSLIQLYESEIEWLSYGSRMWFGQITGHKIALLLDFSDKTCLGESYDQYMAAVQLLVKEQLVTKPSVQVMAIGTDYITPEPSEWKFSTNSRSFSDLYVIPHLPCHVYHSCPIVVKFNTTTTTTIYMATTTSNFGV